MLRNAGELAKQEQNTVTWVSFRENATTLGAFDTFADEHGRRDHLGGRAADRLIELAQTRLASVPVIVPVDLERICAAQHQLGMSPCARPCTNLPRSTSMRSTSTWQRDALVLNAISTDEELIDKLGND
jgi:hypothetical protein